MKKVLVVLAAMLLATGCIFVEHDSHDTAELRITFNPNPVYRSGDGRWYYTVTVQEITGIGVSITGFKVVRYNSYGELIGEDSYFGNEFPDWFINCGGSGYYIAGGTLRCGEIWSSGTSGYREWIFYGVDDDGNSIAFAGRVTVVN